MTSDSRSDFERCVLVSGLLDERQLDEARSGVRWSDGSEDAADAPPTDQQLANRLVEMGLLNGWQASQLLEGRTKFTLGSYRIIDAIGQGGMGQVFKAEQMGQGRIVAVKVLPIHKTTPETVANFANEIRTLARLNSDRLVRSIDSGYDGNVYFLVTEFVPGMDLRKLVKRDGPLNMEAAATIVSQVAEGLAHAHSQGLVHRDVKPGNVLVTPGGDAKLSDLGLAGPLEGDAESDPRFGKIVGTADYLSPDHIKAPWEPTPAWDIYSLGCTLYYAVTGKVPFPGGSTAEKARAHCELRPLDPRRLNPSLSNEFVDVLADMMAKEPEQRIASAEEVVMRLRPWVRSAGRLGAFVDAPGQPFASTPPPIRRNVAPGLLPGVPVADTIPMNPDGASYDRARPVPNLVLPLDEAISAGYLAPGFVLRRPTFSVWERYWWFWTLVLPLGVIAFVLLLTVLLMLFGPAHDHESPPPVAIHTMVEQPERAVARSPLPPR